MSSRSWILAIGFLIMAGVSAIPEASAQWNMGGMYPGFSQSLYQPQVMNQMGWMDPMMGGNSYYSMGTGQWPQASYSSRNQGYDPFQDPMWVASVQSQWNNTVPMGSTYRPIVGMRAIQDRQAWDQSARQSLFNQPTYGGYGGYSPPPFGTPGYFPAW